MTEAEWLASTQTVMMLRHLQGKASDRKLRLFGVACSRRAWHLMPDERSKRAVDVAERYADGVISSRHRGQAWREARAALRNVSTGVYSVRLLERAYRWTAEAAADAVSKNIEKVACLLGNGIPQALGDFACIQESGDGPYSNDTSNAHFAAEYKEQVALAHDIFGNPFRSVVIEPAWLTSTVIALATGIYEEKAFDRMPILADALQDAGCANEDILNHSRSDGPHVRGCWVVDLLLGKG